MRLRKPTLPNPDASVTSIAKLLGVSPGTLYNHIPDLRELRASGGLSRQIPRARATGPNRPAGSVPHD
jgi:transposase-like protein